MIWANGRADTGTPISEGQSQHGTYDDIDDDVKLHGRHTTRRRVVLIVVCPNEDLAGRLCSVIQ
jgi:hypothetical protein